LAVVSLLVSAAFGLLFLIDAVRFRKQINRYVIYGAACGLILVGIDTAILLVLPDGVVNVTLLVVALHDLVAFVKTALFTCMGMYCCSILGLQAFPAFTPGRQSDDGCATLGRQCLLIMAATVALAAVYSVVLFRLAMPRVSELLRFVSEAHELGNGPSAMAALVLLEAAFGEEIMFRLGIQNYLARQFKLRGDRYWIAILLTAAFWSIAHASMLDPEWVKIAQVAPLGLALGFLFRRYGTVACIIVHGAFNIIMMFLSSGLLIG